MRHRDRHTIYTDTDTEKTDTIECETERQELRRIYGSTIVRVRVKTERQRQGDRKIPSEEREQQREGQS